MPARKRQTCCILLLWMRYCVSVQPHQNMILFSFIFRKKTSDHLQCPNRCVEKSVVGSVAQAATGAVVLCNKRFAVRQDRRLFHPHKALQLLFLEFVIALFILYKMVIWSQFVTGTVTDREGKRWKEDVATQNIEDTSGRILWCHWSIQGKKM